MRYLLLTLVLLFVLQGCDSSTDSEPTAQHGSVRVGTRLTFEVFNQLTMKRETLLMEIVEVGATYSGKTNVTRALLTPVGMLSDEAGLNMETNGNYSVLFGDGDLVNWAEMPIATKQEYDGGTVTLPSGNQVDIFHRVVKYLGSSTVTVENVSYPIEQSAIDYFDTTYTTSGDVVNVDESRVTYSFSRDLDFLTGIHITSGGNVRADVRITLIKIED